METKSNILRSSRSTVGILLICLSFQCFLATPVHAQSETSGAVYLPPDQLSTIDSVVCGFLEERWQGGAILKNEMYLSHSRRAQNLTQIWQKLKRKPNSNKKKLAGLKKLFNQYKKLAWNENRLCETSMPIVNLPTATPTPRGTAVPIPTATRPLVPTPTISPTKSSAHSALASDESYQVVSVAPQGDDGAAGPAQAPQSTLDKAQEAAPQGANVPAAVDVQQSTPLNSGAGAGLSASYYSSKDLSAASLFVTKVDQEVNFNWDVRSPLAGMPADNFSVRWKGDVLAPVTGTFTFVTQSDDGVRLWINNTQIINAWNNNKPGKSTGQIRLVEGKRYPIVLEYFENTEKASVSLSWEAPNLPNQVVHSSFLFPVPLPKPNGTGLSATYYSGNSPRQSSPILTRNDSLINFNWGDNSPAKEIPSDRFSVIWNGRLQAPRSGNVTLITESDDGVRLFVDGIPVIDNWTNHSLTKNQAILKMDEGEQRNIRLEYFENVEKASIKLKWSAPSLPEEVVPTSNLFPVTLPPSPPTPEEYTYYPAIPAGAIRLSPGMNLQAEIEKHPTGSAFVIAAGLHRMQAIKPRSGDKFWGEIDAEGNRRTVMNGSRIVTGFVKEGKVWVVTGQTQSPGQIHGICEEGYTRCGYSQDLFIDNKPQLHVNTIADVSAGGWFFDYDNDKIYLGSDPTGKTIEVGDTKIAFYPSANDVSIFGLVVEKYAAPAQFGAIGAQFAADSWRVEYVEARLNHGNGINIGHYSRAVRNKLVRNGVFGGQSRAADRQGCKSCIFNGNEFAYNHYTKIYRGWGAGGIKFAKTSGIIIRNNYVHHNAGPGLWTDINNRNSLYENNIVYMNEDEGIFHEISFDAIIRNNKIGHNGMHNSWLYGANIFISTSQNVQVYGNYIEVDANFGHGITMVLQNRCDKDFVTGEPVGLGQCLYSVQTKNNRVFKNRVIYFGPGGHPNPPNGSFLGGSGAAGSPTPWQNDIFSANNLFVNNSYIVSGAGGEERFYWTNKNNTLAEMQSLGQEIQSSLAVTVVKKIEWDYVWHCGNLVPKSQANNPICHSRPGSMPGNMPNLVEN